MRNNKRGGEIGTLPRDWPSGDWCPPKAVIDRMTRAEVSRLIASVRRELDAMAAWNDRRGDWTPLSDFFEGLPPPNSPNDYGKLRTR
jgi:hypothetical protein